MFIMMLAACKNKNTNYSKKEGAQQEFDLLAAKKLSTQQCALCHNNESMPGERIGPTIAEIKKAYMIDNKDQASFVKAIQNWVAKLDPSISKMPEAIQKYNVMPMGAYKTNDVANIARYWYQQKEEKKSDILPTTPEEKGIAIALGTKKVLGKNLMGTIQKKGTSEALEFCNENAIKLTDSMANKFQATIRRLSDKARNPDNQADAAALEVITQYKKELSLGKALDAVVQDKGEIQQFYYPITTNSMCLQCHGVPQKNIKPAVLKNIKARYPLDKALGYDVNQLRGVWSITFSK